MKFRQKTGKNSPFKTYMAVLFLSLLIVMVVAVAFIRKSYSDNLRPVSSSHTSHVVTVAPGSTTTEIADTLLEKGVIRSDWAFEWYIRQHQLGDEIKAGTFVLYEDQTVGEIVDVLVDGKVATDLVTITPGQNIKQIREDFVNKYKFSADAVDAALDPAQYATHPALTDKPADASLEGYLYPDSFQKTAETTPQEIIKLSLDEMQSKLTPDVRQAFSKQGLTVHQAVTLASIIEREVPSKKDREQAAQVFLKRYRSDIALQSDATARYGAVLAGQPSSVTFDSAYNTYSHKGLPPGPISNASVTALEAVANPAGTDWLYFVADDNSNDVTHFSKTIEEHEANIAKYCQKKCNE